MLNLIADSGIQFYTTEAEFDPAQPLTLPSGRPLRYSFCNILNTDTGERLFDLLSYNSAVKKFIPVSEMVKYNAEELLADGRRKLDESGVEMMRADVSPTLYSQIDPGDADRLYTINAPGSYKVPVPGPNVHEKVPAFDIILGKWLPMPMFEIQDGVSGDVPFAWCRVRIDKLEDGRQAGSYRYRFTWAFDTRTSTDEAEIWRPSFPIEGIDKMGYALCDQVSNMLTFMSRDGSWAVFSSYIKDLLSLKQDPANLRYIAWYIYLINFIRKLGVAPEVTLYRCPAEREIPVDMVLDIGNSRTCGLLFENGDFTKVAMLSLRDMTNPGERPYSHPFDMRVVFRQTYLGSDIVIEGKNMFFYPSMVRVGDEAKKLVYLSVEQDGLWTNTTNYSSPKRYLWDNEQFKQAWKFLTTEKDPLYLRDAENIYVSGLSDLFDAAGNYIREDQDIFSIEQAIDGHTHYSRASLMTFVLIEILNQALMQINSPEFREHGDKNCRRTLRRLIMTCPTAMPKAEQIKLRQCAEDAFKALKEAYKETYRQETPKVGDPKMQEALENEAVENLNRLLPDIEVYPSVEKLTAASDAVEEGTAATWSYDEATCSQLVYLYGEIAERYRGRVREFFKLKGHVRPELVQEGYTENALTVASVDIGAGTTDAMVCTYTCSGNDEGTLSPRPIFWDSFYVAGDDILRNIIQNIVIEDHNSDDPEQGSVYSALSARLTKMTVDEIAEIPVVSRAIRSGDGFYRDMVNDLRALAGNDREIAAKKRELASGLIRNFFGVDSTNMDARARRCRVDFNTQISHPMAQFFMEMLRRHRPSRLYSFNEIFATIRPSQYLLDYFADHFGFRFEELRWRFEPDRVAGIVRSTMERLLKQISIMLYAHNCDIIVLSGRPTSLDAITELFVKYVPVTPDRLVRLNEYRVGQWYPLADPNGYFHDQKAVVAVGAMIGHLASTTGFNGMVIRFDDMIKRFHSTSNYICLYGGDRMDTTVLTPTHNSETLTLTKFPAFFGAKQFDHPYYEGRPVYMLDNNSGRRSLRVTISRDYMNDPERLEIEDVTDENGDQISNDMVLFREQSILKDGQHWLDTGEFELSVQSH